MEVFKFIELDNGDIRLEKIIIDNTKYDIINKDNGDILLKKIKNINITDIKDIKKFDFQNSVISKCLINNINPDRLNYRPILNYIYELIIKSTK